MPVGIPGLAIAGMFHVLLALLAPLVALLRLARGQAPRWGVAFRCWAQAVAVLGAFLLTGMAISRLVGPDRTGASSAVDEALPVIDSATRGPAMLIGTSVLLATVLLLLGMAVLVYRTAHRPRAVRQP